MIYVPGVSTNYMVVPALDLCSSSCCNTLIVYSVKADIDSEEMVVLTLSVSLVSFMGYLLVTSQL